MTKNRPEPFLLFALLPAFLLGGCGGPKYGHAPVTPQVMSCAGNHPAQVILYSPAEAKLTFEEKTYALNRIETAAGVQYGNSDITFWNKGIDAMIIRKDGSMTTCTYMPKGGL